MSFHFEIMRTIQCAAYLLSKTSSHRINYTCLLKMLYLADRKSIESASLPITGDRMVAMDNGPLLSKTYDLIKGRGSEEEQALWSRYIARDGFDVVLDLDPGIGQLTDHDTSILDQVFAEHGTKSFGELIRHVHELSEWSDAYDGKEGTSVEIPLRTLLRALGREDDIERLSKDRVESAHFANLFGC